MSYSENSVSWIFTCPHCFKQKKMYVRKRDGRFVCWRCKETDGFQGRAEFGLSELLGVPLSTISRQLYGDVALRNDPTMESCLSDFFGFGDDIDEDAFEHDVIEWPYDYYPIDHPFSKRGLEYLKGRGIGLRLAKEYGLRYCPETRRVYFPISDGGRLYGYQGRLIVPHEYVDEEGEKQEVPKVLSSKGMRRDRALMFMDRLRGVDHAVLCEGPVDAMKAHYCKGNVATMGKEVSDYQLNMLLGAGVKRIYIALDPDAWETISSLDTRLYGQVELYLMMPPKGKKDLGEMNPEEVYQLFLDARPFEVRLFVDIDGLGGRR